jgi:hypothetical protein
MLNPSAVYTTGGHRLTIDSEIEVIMREKARFKIGLGWTYRFKSGQAWVLVSLDKVDAWEFAEKPEATTVSDEQAPERRSMPRPKVPSEARYIEDLM